VVKKIIALVLTLAIIISCVSFPASAQDITSETVSFWDSIVLGLRNGAVSTVSDLFGSSMGSVAGKVTSTLSSNVCGSSSDGLHHAAELLGTGGKDSNGQYIDGICSFCGDHFKCYSDDVATMYNDFIADKSGDDGSNLAFNSAGQYKVYLRSLGALEYYRTSSDVTTNYITPSIAYSYFVSGSSDDIRFVSRVGFESIHTFTGTFKVYKYGFLPWYKFTAPFDCNVKFVITQFPVSFSVASSLNGSRTSKSSTVSYNLISSAGSVLSSSSSFLKGENCNLFYYYNASAGVGYRPVTDYSNLIVPYALCTPITSSSDVSLSVNTRITNRITNIYNISNSTTYNNFFNEENNTYIDMSGTSYTVNNWEYDYSSRFYSFDYTDSDEINHTVVITYADDFVTVTDNGTTNYYYYGMPSSSGDDGSGDSSGGSSSGSGDSSGGSSIDYTPAINDIIEKLTTLVQQGEQDAEYQEKVLEYLSNIESYDKQTFDTLLNLLNNVNQGLFYTAEDGTTYTVSELAYYIYNYLKDNLDVKTSVISGLLEKILTAIENISPSVDVDIDIDGDGEADSVDTWFSSFLGKFAFIGTLYDCGKQLIADVTGDAASAQAVAAGEVSADDLQTVHVASIASVDDDSASSDADIAVTDASYTVPEMLLNFPSVSWHGVNMGNMSAINLSWYAPYKSTVDNLVSGFLWLAFIWLIFKRAPSIIQGAGMAEETALKIDSYNRR
jgi:uncharacterized membrane protein YgcG